MPSNKPEIKTRVIEEKKKLFFAQARSRNISEAKLLEMLIDAFLDQTPLPPEPSDISRTSPDKPKEVRVKIFTTNYDALLELALERSWKPGTYISNLVDVHLSGNPRFSSEEMIALREASNSLTSIGRNVNQIAKALNASMENAHLVQSLPFDDVKNLIDEERNAVKSLIKSNLKTWGVSDVS